MYKRQYDTSRHITSHHITSYHIMHIMSRHVTARRVKTREENGRGCAASRRRGKPNGNMKPQGHHPAGSGTSVHSAQGAAYRRRLPWLCTWSLKSAYRTASFLLVACKLHKKIYNNRNKESKEQKNTRPRNSSRYETVGKLAQQVRKNYQVRA